MGGSSITLKQVDLTKIAPVVDRVVSGFALLLADNCGLSDAEALSSSRRQCGRSVSSMEDRGESDIYAIVEESTETVGYVWLAGRDIPAESTLHILDIWIAEEHRRKGFGKKAIDLIIAQSRQRGINTVTLNVFASNSPAIGLYEKLGFKTYSQSMMLTVSDGRSSADA